MKCLFQVLAGDVKHPDHMKRADMIKYISSFEDEKSALYWWLKYASHKISKKAFNNARSNIIKKV